MAQERTLLVKIAGDSSSLDRALKKSAASGKDYEKQVGLVSRAHSGLSKSAIFAATSLVGGAGLVSALHSSVDAAVKAEESQKRLQSQLAALGISYQDHARQIDSVIQKQSQLAALDDEDLQASFTALVRVTKDVTKALDLNGVAADVARGKNVSLEQATMIVTKASLGQLGALKRMGVEIQPVTTAMDALKESHVRATQAQKEAAKAADQTATRQQALAILQKQFTGAAEAYGKTAAGAQDRLKVATENLRESIGVALLPAVTKVSNAVSGWIGKSENQEKVQHAVNETVKVAGQVIDAMWPKIQTAAHWADELAKKVGGWDKAFEIILGGVLVSKVAGLTGTMGGLRGQTAGASGAVAGLARNLGGIAGKVFTVALVYKVAMDIVGPGPKVLQSWGNLKGAIQNDLHKIIPQIPKVDWGASGASDVTAPPGLGGPMARTTASASVTAPPSMTGPFASSGVDLSGAVAKTGGGGGGGGSSNGSPPTSDTATLVAKQLAAIRNRMRQAILAGQNRNFFAFDVANVNNQFGPLSGFNTDSIAADKDRARAAVEAVKARIDAMKQAVDSKRTVFSGAFGQLGEAAVKAFDARTAKMQADLAGRLKTTLAEIEKARVALTPEEQALADFQKQRAADARAAARAEAMAMEDGAEKTARLRELDLDDRERSLTDAATLSRKARDDDARLKAEAEQTAYDTEKQALDEQQALEKQAFQDKLTNLSDYLANREKSVADANARIRETFGEFASGLDAQIGDTLNKLAAVRAAAAGAAAPYAGSTIATLPTGQQFYYPMAAGGDFMVNGPTMFLAGEAGPERATFSRTGGRNYHGGGSSVIVNVAGSVVTERELSQIIRRELIAASKAGATTSVVARSRTGL